MRRRNKPKVVWLPQTNTNSLDDLSRSSIGFFALTVNHQNLGNTNTVEAPIVLDGISSSPLDPTSSLSDIEDSGYRLRRICGNIWVECAQSATDNVAVQIVVSAGFIIRRTNSQTGLSLAGTGGAANIALDDIENSMDPWIWRRSWILDNVGTLGNGPVGEDALQNITSSCKTNFGRDAGTLNTGPFVDQKTARIVGPEERLFLDVQATVLLPNAVAGDTDTAIAVIHNLRVLASMRTSVGNRRNASR